jgi:hypothetical protein
MSARPVHSRERGSDRWLAPAVGLCAAGPVIGSTLRALHDGWVPAGDQANIATRAYDVFTSRTPLLGLHSDVSALTHHAVYSLGPMLFWLLAVPARVASPGSLAFTMGMVNSGAIVGVIVLARRRGGRTLMLITALAVVLMSRSLAPEALHDVWNPSAGLFPFTLLGFLCWSVGCGEYRLLPLTVLVASFVAQCQLAFVPPALGVVAVAIGGLGVSIWSSRVRSDAGEAGASRGAWRWAVAALLVAVVCWAPTAIDQIEGKPGNLTAVVRTAEANTSTLGGAVGWRAVALAVGIRPWWLSNTASPFERKNELRVAAGPLATVSALLALCALAGVTAIGVIRRRAELWVGALIAIALCAGLAAVAATTPTTRLLSATLGYTMWSGSPVGMFAWVLLAWAPAAILAGRVRLLARRASPTLVGVLGVGAIAAGAVAVAAGERADEHLGEYRPLDAMLGRLDRDVPRGRTVKLVGDLGNATFRVKMAARFALLRRGIRPISPGTDTRLGSWYELDHHRYDCTVYVKDGTASPASAAELIASVVYGAGHPVSAWVAPAGCPPGRSLGPGPRPQRSTRRGPAGGVSFGPRRA